MLDELAGFATVLARQPGLGKECYIDYHEFPGAT